MFFTVVLKQGCFSEYNHTRLLLLLLVVKFTLTMLNMYVWCIQHINLIEIGNIMHCSDPCSVVYLVTLWVESAPCEHCGLSLLPVNIVG